MEKTKDNRCLNPDQLGDYFWNFVTKETRADSVFQDTFYSVARQDEWSAEAIKGLGADTFAALFQINPTMVDKPPAGYDGLHQIMEAILNSPDVDALRKNTKMNEMISTMTWPTFFTELYRQVKELVPEPQAPTQPQGGDGDGDEDEDGDGDSDGDGDENNDDDEYGQPAPNPNGGEGQTPVDTTALDQAVSNAVDKAEDEMDSFQKAWGSETADFQSMTGDERLELAEKLMQSHSTLDDIMELAGRWKKITIQKKREKLKAQESIVGLEIGNNLTSALPSELMRLNDDLLKLDLFKRYTESKLLQYEYEGEKKVGAGPIVVCVDCSGSMSGKREVYAKALTVAMARLGRNEKRPIRVVLFSSNAEVYDSPDPMKGKAWVDYLVDVANRFSGGGTDFNQPLNLAMESIENHPDYSRADVVFITDGEAYVDEGVMERLKTNKKEKGFNLFTIFVGNWAECDTLEAISDKVWNISKFDEKTGLEILEKSVI
jgi:uncharacterized protein YegL